MLSNPKELEKILNNIESWCNEKAYPVQPVSGEGKGTKNGCSNQTIPDIKEELAEIIEIQKEMP